ncbi:Trm112 family protein [Micromonospora tulbaghiae]|uniref:Uncharacterized protein n=1 Tax=Micromonospora tulbaghiae TaxID=479978 RepID=A0ABY0KHL6_9ACTN|nr:Trm112 family protein [Micromonospora tulbaghiae]MDX5459233.1 Trm112 family protein [Micromonospora tulbaghiae]SCE73658.1 hypothetical protein GA0070562_2136 [Micromonospora tulbaghiae]
MSLDPLLLDIIRCPDEPDAMLRHDADRQQLTCVSCGRVFPVRGGVPVLLPASASGGSKTGK